MRVFKDKTDKFGEPLNQWLAHRIVHQSYMAASFGPNNSIEKKIERLAKAFGKLATILYEEGDLVKSDILSFVEDNLGYDEKDFVIHD